MDVVISQCSIESAYTLPLASQNLYLAHCPATIGQFHFSTMFGQPIFTKINCPAFFPVLTECFYQHCAMYNTSIIYFAV